MRLLVCSTLALTLAACSGTTSYVSEVVVPRSDLPVFTVIPKDLTSTQVSFANRVERCLLPSRLIVIERPTFVQEELTSSKEVRERRGGASSVDVQKATIDFVATYSTSRADIIVATDVGTRRVKFLDQRYSNRIVRTSQIPEPAPAAPSPVCKVVGDDLNALGI